MSRPFSLRRTATLLGRRKRLSYKLGQLKIRELRDRAQKELGAKFDIKAFHDEMLDGGALPLDLLDARTDKWIAEQKAK